MSFKQKFNNIVKKNNSLVCVGLDPDLEKLPSSFLKKKNSIFEFNKSIIDATFDLVCAYKPNIAFYEAYGIEGLQQLKLTFEYLQEKHSQIPIILDAKRADIGNTAKGYARAAFEYWNTDAVTVYPNLGLDSVLPFLKYKNKLTILLIKTSNPDSVTFQNISINKEPYYLKMSKVIKNWEYDNFGLFVGATYPTELKMVRNIFPDRIFLSAGIGVQNAEVEKAVKAGIDSEKNGIAFNASRSIIYSNNPREQTLRLRNMINKYR